MRQTGKGMDISLFGRGIRVRGPSEFGAVAEAPPPARAVLLLRQGEEAPASPVVERGETVLAGQKIAEDPEGWADLHAPVSGEVVEIVETRLPDGGRCGALAIESDGEDTRAELEHDDSPLSRSAEDLLDRIRRAGVFHGTREARPLAAVIDEARAPRGTIRHTGSPIVRPLEHLVVRFCDVDPFAGALRAVTAQIGEETGDLRLGVEVLLRVTGAAAAHFALERRQAAPGVEKLADEVDWAVLRVDGSNYPMAADPFLARAATGKEPPLAFQRVHESGTLVVDVTSVLEVARAVRDGAPVTDRIVSVLGPGGETRVLRARLGTSLADLCGEAGRGDGIGKIVLGGLLSGTAHYTLDHPLSKGVSAIALMRGEDIPAFENAPCIGCGLCSMVCPCRLVPGMLSRYCEFGQWERAEAAHLFNCIECGSCAYVCPAGRSMVQYMIQGKTEILAERRAG